MNVASYLSKRALETPSLPALFYPMGHLKNGSVSYKGATFQELNRLSDEYAWKLQKIGIQKSHRMILMVTPGIDFVALTFALLKLGAIVVLIDPGIDRKYLKTSIQNVRPDGFIGIAKAHLLRWLWPSSFRTSQFHLVIGTHWFFGIPRLYHTQKHIHDSDTFPLAILSPQDPAAIIFTTGSTGLPKGVVYEHGMFDAQIKILQNFYGIKEGEIDMPTFPLFALFSAAMGTTCVIPDMNPTKPAAVDPKKIIQALTQFQVTYSFGSPALWNRVTRYCIEKKIKLPMIQRILIAGAPVPISILQRFQHILSEKAKVYTPYGATEALPVSSIESREILFETEKMSRQGKGICIGSPFENTTVKIIKITDAPIYTWDEKLILPHNSIGEIVVKGAHITRQYFGNELETKLAKMIDSKGTSPENVWHRMGDLGYLDSKNRLWFCGRKAHRVVTPLQTYFTEPCESIFNEHPKVFRSALVGVNISMKKKPLIVIEPHHKKLIKISKEREELKQELLRLARQYPHTQDITEILFHPNFPVDIRHNSKILREKLSEWARTQR